MVAGPRFQSEDTPIVRKQAIIKALGLPINIKPGKRKALLAPPNIKPGKGEDTALAVAMLAESAGLPKGVVNVLAGYGHSTGQAAMSEPAVKKVVFVGSMPTGRRLQGI